MVIETYTGIRDSLVNPGDVQVVPCCQGNPKTSVVAFLRLWIDKGLLCWSGPPSVSKYCLTWALTAKRPLSFFSKGMICDLSSQQTIHT